MEKYELECQKCYNPSNILIHISEKEWDGDLGDYKEINKKICKKCMIGD